MTDITNSTATTDIPDGVEFCQRSGMRARRGELVQELGTGLLVLPEFADGPEKPMRKPRDSGLGSPAPEQEDRFLSTNEVSASDL